MSKTISLAAGGRMKKPPKLHDDSPMPWGQHRGTPMRQVPADYLLELGRKPWIHEWPAVVEYIEANWARLEKEFGAMEKRQPEGPFKGYEDYQKYGRN
jgi:hypothetical protein